MCYVIKKTKQNNDDFLKISVHLKLNVLNIKQELFDFIIFIRNMCTGLFGPVSVQLWVAQHIPLFGHQATTNAEPCNKTYLTIYINNHTQMFMIK